MLQNIDLAPWSDRQTQIWNQSGPGSLDVSLKGTLLMKTLLRKLAIWFHSADDNKEPPRITINTPEDGARVGMTGWY